LLSTSKGLKEIYRIVAETVSNFIEGNQNIIIQWAQKVYSIACTSKLSKAVQGLSHEIQFKYYDKMDTLGPNRNPYWFMNFKDESLMSCP
jgi:hypothetical protein